MNIPAPQDDSLPAQAAYEERTLMQRSNGLARALNDFIAAIRQWAARAKETIARLQGLEITPQVRNEIGNEAQRVEQRWHDFRKSNKHAGRCTLAGAQLFVARAHGFASWLKFAKHVEALARADTPVSKFEMAVDAIIRGDAAILKSLLRENPELGLWPRERFPFVTELAASGFTIELPGDLDAITIHPAIPGLRFPAQSLKVGDSSVP